MSWKSRYLLRVAEPPHQLTGNGALHKSGRASLNSFEAPLASPPKRLSALPRSASRPSKIGCQAPHSLHAAFHTWGWESFLPSIYLSLEHIYYMQYVAQYFHIVMKNLPFKPSIFLPQPDDSLTKIYRDQSMRGL